ncbi:hypothetical protein N9937_00555 [bacterium]|nr:hypothetical protein [bacterium]
MPILPTPKIVYRPVTFTITAGTNDKIDFEETGSSELTATLTAGTYTKGGMAAELKRALEVAGASTYTIAFALSGSNINKFTVTSDGIGGGGVLNLLWNTGTNTATSAKTTLGFDNTDDTGALTYNSDNQAPATVTITFNNDVRSPQIAPKEDVSKHKTARGKKKVISRHVNWIYSFSLQFIPRTLIDSFYTFYEDCLWRGGQFDFYPKSSAGTFVNFTYEKGFKPTAMTKKNLYQLYSFRGLMFREVGPDETVNTPGGRGSRVTVLTDRASLL